MLIGFCLLMYTQRRNISTLELFHIAHASQCGFRTKHITRRNKKCFLIYHTKTIFDVNNLTSQLDYGEKESILPTKGACLKIAYTRITLYNPS